MTRWEIKDAVLSSTLTPTQRLVMLVLVLRADTESGQIPPHHSPSRAVLARETGLSSSTLHHALGALGRLGWVGHIPPTKAEQLRGARNVYVLDVPPDSVTEPGGHSVTESGADRPPGSVTESGGGSVAESAWLGDRADSGAISLGHRAQISSLSSGSSGGSSTRAGRSGDEDGRDEGCESEPPPHPDHSTDAHADADASRSSAYEQVCPWCGVDPGQRCRTHRGAVLRNPHDGRVQLASVITEWTTTTSERSTEP